jgi:hypothetical protein
MCALSRCLLPALLLCCGCVGAPPAQAAPPVDLPAAPVALPAAPTEPPAPPPPAPEPVAPAPEPLAPTAPPAYPQAWIAEAMVENQASSCHELIYKQGCYQTRTGTVAVELALAPDGTVTRVKQLENTIRRDPALVGRCLDRKLRRWKLHAPGAAVPVVRLTLHFGDKC